MLVIGGGFTGSEVASVCRMLDVDVTLVELADAPLSGALGGVIGAIAADMQRDAGVDLRTGVRVDAIESDERGRVSGVRSPTAPSSRSTSSSSRSAASATRSG